MAQHDQVIDNGPGLVVRQDINSAIAALFSTSSGPVEPQVATAGQLWLDTSVLPNGQLKQRNLTNNGWVAPNITLGTADLWFGTRLSPDRFIWNDQANGAGNDIMSLSERGWLNLGLPGGTAGLNASVGISAKVDETGGDYVVINDKADGTGTDTIKLRNNGQAEFGNAVIARGASAQFSIKPTTGNGHLWFYAADGTTRAVIYTASGAQGNLILQVGASGSLQITPAGVLTSSAGWSIPANGNLSGSIWSGWGAADSFSAISARIESRAQAWAVNYYNSAVIDTRMAGEVAFNRSGNTGKWQNSGYVFTGVQGTSSGGDATYFARQPQRLINTQGWAAAFIF
jgi:hypothetical protein